VVLLFAAGQRYVEGARVLRTAVGNA
jgi:hypothetical protein